MTSIIIRIILAVIFLYALLVFLWSLCKRFKTWMNSEGWLKAKQAFCNHDYRKVTHKFVHINNYVSVEQTKYKCRKCGKIIYRR